MNAGPQLKDIHLPAEPGLWPWPPGLWLLAVIALCLLLWLLASLLREYRHSRERRRWRAALALIASDTRRSDQERVAAASELLRRAVRARAAQAAALQGKQWRDYLLALGPLKLDAGDLDLLLEAPYRPHLREDQAERALALISDRLQLLLRQRP